MALMICTQVVASMPRRHVHQHHAADDDDRPFVGQAEHQLDQVARADHLRQHVEQERQDAAEGRGDPHRHLTKSEGNDVGECELAQVSQGLGDEKDERGPADQPARRVNHAVVPAQRHEAGDTEKRRRAHVVASQREAVLKRTDRSTGGVELVRRPGAARRPVRHAERERDDDEEEEDRGEGRRPERRLHGENNYLVIS
jgi:hypothetical protein